jgi:hypothetical protein
MEAFSWKKMSVLIGLALTATFLGLVFSTGTARAELVRHSTPDDLFYNYYAPPVGPRSVGAELYVSPRPTPPMVGHTYITYPPLMPHEFLYKHARHYKTVHDDAANTRTTVRWR